MRLLRNAVLLALGMAAVTFGHTRAAAGPELLAPTASPLSGSYLAGNFCLVRNTPEQYATMFDSEPGGVIGADYQRATPMPNGDVLWTFQDAEIRLPNGHSTLVHNIGLIQSGTCFAILIGGTREAPQPWLFASDTVPFAHWYWPMDATMGADGRMYVYLAEMFERGSYYLDRVEPTSTAVAAIDIDNWDVEHQGPARDSSPSLYGWTSATDDRWTYLYAHCYRQFGYDLHRDGWFRVHDSSCTAKVTLSRVPRGELFAAPQYWTGNGWSSIPERASPILQTAGRVVNAADITHVNNRWLVVVKVDDWFGNTILVESSPRPTGPFDTIMTLPATPKCDAAVCNTYFASWIPKGPDGTMTIGLSNNRWDGVFSDVYRPTYRTIPTPAFTMSPADRCQLGHCG